MEKTTQTQAVQALQFKARRQETRVFRMIRSSKMNPYTSVAAIADHLPRLWGINRARRGPSFAFFAKGGIPGTTNSFSTAFHNKNPILCDEQPLPRI